MIHARVLSERITSADGNVTAEAKSVAIAFGDSQSKISQAVTVKVSSGNCCSSSSTSSSASAT